MTLEIRGLDAAYEKKINFAAALAQKQLEYATEIVQLARPGASYDPVLIAAVLAAIASNHAALIEVPHK